MNVRLIAITKPVTDGMETPGQLTAYCARVSNPDNQHNHDTAHRLLRYLADHAHWSPFEMVHAVLEIRTTRDISRQIIRHRSFSFQEFSGRYAKMPAGWNTREARMQDTENRQSSLPCNNKALAEWWRDEQAHIAQQAMNAYQFALSQGIAKEVARAVLPEGLTPTRLYMAGTLRSWMHYVQLRSGPETQKEHREIASQCGKVLAEAVPELADFFAVGGVPLMGGSQ